MRVCPPVKSIDCLWGIPSEPEPPQQASLTMRRSGAWVMRTSM